MAFGDNMKETRDPSQENDKKSSSEILESLLNDPNPPHIETMQQQIHEERIRNAPKIVQDFYAGKVNQFDKGLFKVLVAKKSNRIIFIVMIFCLLIVFINGTVGGGRKNLKVVNGYECELQSFSYDGTCYASLRIHPVAQTRKRLEKITEDPDHKMYYPMYAAFRGITQAEIEVPMEQEFAEELFLDEQILRTSTDDCDIMYIICKVRIGNKEEELKAKVSHKIQ